MSIAEPPLEIRPIPDLLRLCEDVDAFLNKERTRESVGEIASELVALCTRSGIEIGENDDAIAAINRLKDRRYELGADLERLQTLLAQIDEYGARPSTDLMNAEAKAVCESLCRQSGIEFDEATEHWQMGQWLAEKAHELRGGIPGDTEDMNAAAEPEADPVAAEKAAKEAAKLAKYQAEWEERGVAIKEGLVALDLQIHDIDCDIAPLNTAKRELNKKKSALLIELGYRRHHGMPTSLPKSGDGLTQTTMDFDADDDGPLLTWKEDVDREEGDCEYHFAESAKLDSQGQPLLWRIHEVESAFLLYRSDGALNPPGEETAFADIDLAKAEAERLERAIRDGEQSKTAETDPRRLAIRLERLGLPKGILSKLADAAIDTLGDVAACTAMGKSLDSIPGIKGESVAKIADAIAKFDDEYAKDPDVAIAKYGG